MRATISMALAVTLFTVPITQVAAQAGQQAQAAVSDSTATPPCRIGVPDVEGEKAALVWLAGSVKTATDSFAYPPPYRSVSTTDWVGIVIGGLIVLVVSVILISDGEDPDCCVVVD